MNRPISIKTLLSTYTFWREELSLSTLKRVREAGFSEIEIFCMEGHFDWQNPAQCMEIMEAAEALRINVPSFHAPFDEQGGYDISSSDPDIRRNTVENTLTAINVLHRFRGKTFIIHPGICAGNLKQNCVGNSIESLKVICDAADKLGISVALENPGPGSLGFSADEYNSVWSGIDSHSLTICLDIGHAVLSPGGHHAFLGLPECPVAVHLSDNLGKEDDHLFPGEGSIDWQCFANSLYSQWGGKIRQINYTFELEQDPGLKKLSILAEWWEELLSKAMKGN